MKLQVYTIWDVQASRGILPIFRQNDEVALRDFTNTCANAESPFHQNPEDYVLYHIGEWDDEVLTFNPEIIDSRRITSAREALAERKVDIDKIQELHREIEILKAQMNGETHPLGDN